MNGAAAPGLHPLTRFVATGAYLGYSPLAPGSVGALGWGILLWFAMPPVSGVSAPWVLGTFGLSVVAFLAIAVWAADSAERALGKDSPRIVVDEFAGFLIAVALLPKTVFTFVAAFLLFRLADILKPFPARRAELLPGGLGVVSDDVVAGVYANVLVRIMLAAGS